MPKEASEWEGRAFLTRPPLQKTKQLGKCLQYRGKIPKKTIKLTLVGLNLDYCERLLIASPSSSRASPTKPGQSRRSFVHAPVNSHRHARGGRSDTGLQEGRGRRSHRRNPKGSTPGPSPVLGHAVSAPSSVISAGSRPLQHARLDPEGCRRGADRNHPLRSDQKRFYRL